MIGMGAQLLGPLMFLFSAASLCSTAFAQDDNWRRLSPNEADRVQRLTTNTAQLKISMEFDRSEYFPGEDATVTLHVENPTSKAMEVYDPFDRLASIILFEVDTEHDRPNPRRLPSRVLLPMQRISLSLVLGGDCKSTTIRTLRCETPRAPYGTQKAYWFYANALATTAQFEILRPNVVDAVEVELPPASREIRDVSGKGTGRVITYRVFARAYLLERNGEHWICSLGSGATSSLAESKANGGSLFLGRLACNYSSKSPISRLALEKDSEGIVVRFRENDRDAWFRVGLDGRRQ